MADRTSPSPPAPSAVIVAGMHRSGTSLTAGLLARLGVDMGRDLVPADRANPRGYFEDLDVVRFHQKVFAATLPSSTGGHADWGWTPNAVTRSEDAGRWRADAEDIVARRVATGRLWGFKDPRATVLLDFWHPLLPAPAYVAVYREPSLVADSMQRLGAEVFLRDPGLAWSIWTFYNRRLLDFVRRYRDRCLLVNVDALSTAVDRLPTLLGERFGLAVPAMDLGNDLARSRLKTHADDDPLPKLARRVWDEAAATFDELESLADLPAEADRGNARRAAPPYTLPTRTRLDELSIIIPTFNDATFLVEALASVERCAPGRYEVLVLDDGTTDPESLRILDRLREAGQPVQRQRNAGLAASRNTCVAKARSRIILPLDADNRLCPGFLEWALEQFRDAPRLGVVYGDRRLFGFRRGRLQVPGFDLRRLTICNYIDACAVFRRELWTDVGGYDESLRLGFEDWEFWMHAGKRSWEFRHLPIVALEYRVRPGSLSSLSNTQEGWRQFQARQWRKHADLLIGWTPAWILLSLGLRPPFPTDLARLPRWQQWAVRLWWGRIFARTMRMLKPVEESPK